MIVTMESEKKSVVKIIRRIFTGVAVAVLSFLTVLVVYVMISRMHGKVAQVFGASVLKVITGSMEPSIHQGDYILVKKTDTDKLKVDDIICFYSEDSTIYGMPNTHRIVGTDSEGNFVTKGDANNYADSVTVSPEKVIGKYDGKVRILRWINSLASVKKIIFLLVIITVTATAVYEVKTITKITKECKEEKEKEIEEEKQRLIREKIEEQKRILYEQGYKPDEKTEDNKGGG